MGLQEVVTWDTESGLSDHRVPDQNSYFGNYQSEFITGSWGFQGSQVTVTAGNNVMYVVLKKSIISTS